MTTRRVLIVDDDEDFRLLVRLHLEAHGYEVVGEAAHGPEALSMAFKLKPDIMTLDYQMPYLTGEQTLEHIEQIRPDTTVVILSGTLTSRPDWAEHYLPKSEVGHLHELLETILLDEP